MMQYIFQTISEIQISYIELNVNNFTLFAKDSVGYHPTAGYLLNCCINR